MPDETLLDHLHAVRKLLQVAKDVELFGTNATITDFRNAVHDVEQSTQRLELRESQTIEIPLPPLPLPPQWGIEFPALPEVPFIIPDVDRTATDAAQFVEIWEQLTEAGICDAWGGAESQRVYGLWVAEGQPKEAARFICFHANRPAPKP